MKKSEIRKNLFTLRIYDDDTLTNLNELQKTGQFDSTNELLNKVVEKGAEALLVSFGKRKLLSNNDNLPQGISLLEIKNKLGSISTTLDDIFVITSIVETLGAMLFNIEYAKITGEPITAELLQSGAYSDLPEWLQEVKDIIIRNTKNRR